MLPPLGRLAANKTTRFLVLVLICISTLLMMRFEPGRWRKLKERFVIAETFNADEGAIQSFHGLVGGIIRGGEKGADARSREDPVVSFPQRVGEAGAEDDGGEHQDEAEVGKQTEGACVDREDEIQSGCEWVRSVGALGSVDEQDTFFKSLKRRWHARVHREDAAWANTTLLGGRRMQNLVPKNYSTWPCNPGSGSCSCLQAWSGADTCSFVAHRQKPMLEVTLESDMEAVNMLDCPTVRCRARFHANHSASSRAFVKWLGYVFMHVIAKFPPKVDEKWNKNVLVSFESSVRFPQLNDSKFHLDNKVDVHAVHTPLGLPAAATLTTSFAELPGQLYRYEGPTFEERSDRVSFFVTNCKGPANKRYFVIDELTRMMKLDSFRHGSCLWWNATQVTMEKDWPQCVRSEIKEKERKEERRYAEKECVLEHSRLTLIVENSYEPFYVSEKIYQALSMGCVPIYKGAPNVKSILPQPDAAILMDEFPSHKDAMDYAKRVNTDKHLWLKHTAWKRKPFSPGFVALLQNQFSLCSVCEYFGKDARNGHLNLRSIGNMISACAVNIFEQARANGSSVHIAPAHAGVDAVFTFGRPSLLLQRSIQRLFSVSPAVVSNRILASQDAQQCFESAVCGGAACGRLACARHLFVAYLCVLHGLQNVLVLPERVSVVGSDSESWAEEETHRGIRQRFELVLRALPAGYGMAALGCASAESDRSADGSSVCGEQPYVMSQDGARQMLLGEGSILINRVAPVFPEGCN